MARDKVTQYEVRDASGALIAIHERIDDEVGKRMVWRLPDGTASHGDLTTADLPLFGTHRLGEWANHVPVVICEGEKAAKALQDVGVPALGTTTGASVTPSRVALADLTGRYVRLWPDADDVGMSHMKRVEAGLKGIAVDVRWIEWTAAPPHGDAFDFLAESPADTVWDLIDTSLPSAARYTFTRKGMGYVARWTDEKVEITFDRISTRSGEVSGELAVRCTDPDVQSGEAGHLVGGRFNASSMETRKRLANTLKEKSGGATIDWAEMLETFCVRLLSAEREGEPFVTLGAKPLREKEPYLLYPILPENRTTIIYAPPGSNKSFLSAAIAGIVATGSDQIVPGWRVDMPRRVLVLDWESDANEWNDRLHRIFAGAKLPVPTAIDYRQCLGPLTDQVEDVSRHVHERGIGLVIVDSTGLALPGTREGTDANDGTLRLFRALRYLRVTSLLIDHVSKASQDKEGGARDPYGSVYKTAQARSTFEIVQETDEGDEDLIHLALVHRKANAIGKVSPMGIAIHFAPGEVTFERELPTAGTATGLTLSKRLELLLRAKGPQTIEALEGVLSDQKRNTIRQCLGRHTEMFVQNDRGAWALLYRLAA